MAEINPASEEYREYFDTVEKFLQSIQDKKVLNLQLIAYVTDEDGETESQVFHHNSGPRDLAAAAGVLNMIAVKMQMEDEEDEDDD